MRMTWLLPLVCLVCAPLSTVLALQASDEEEQGEESPSSAENIAPPKKALDESQFEEVGNYGKIIDNIAYEAKNADNICWVLDHSPSMADDVKEITSRIEALLGGLNKKGAVLNSIVIWSDKPRVHLKPTVDIKAVKESLTKIPFEGKEGSGVENICQAVNMALANRGRGENAVLVVVTDEAGDDDKQFDKTIDALRSSKVKVLVLSPHAAFGPPVWNWDIVHYDEARTEFFFAHNGPENGTPEGLYDFNFIQRSDWSGTINPMDQRVWATNGGWAPYFLQLMAETTGGKVFALKTESHKLQGTFERKKLYKPEIVPLSKLGNTVPAHPWRLAVSKAADAWKGFRTIAREFPGQSKTDLIQGVQAQLPIVDGNITVTNKALALLHDGLGRKPKANYQGGEENLRWRANIELAFASALVARYHLHQFKLDVERFKGSTFWPDPQKDVCQWNIKIVADGKSATELPKLEIYSVSNTPEGQGDTEQAGDMVSMLTYVPNTNASTHEERRKQAEIALLVVMKNHPKTPWATMAAKLLAELGSYDIFINPCGNWGNSSTTQ
ncbi:MAG: vWA domain-containing protein [Planctomycetota bacterium]